jgi:xanthine/uracil permease
MMTVRRILLWGLCLSSAAVFTLVVITRIRLPFLAVLIGVLFGAGLALLTGVVDEWTRGRHEPGRARAPIDPDWFWEFYR